MGTFCAKTPRQRNPIWPQVAGSITSSVALIEFCLSAPLVNSLSVSSIIYILLSIILSSPCRCVFGLTKETLIQKLKIIHKLPLNSISVFTSLIINRVVFLWVWLWCAYEYVCFSTRRAHFECIHSFCARTEDMYCSECGVHACARAWEKHMLAPFEDERSIWVPWFWLPSYFKWLMMA